MKTGEVHMVRNSTLDLSADDLEKLEQYDASIGQHCRTAVDLEFKRQEMLRLIATIESGRKQFFADLVKLSGIDPQYVSSVRVDGDKLHVVSHEPDRDSPAEG